MLVVIAVIAILASLIFPVTKAVNRNKIRSKMRAEMELIATAIESYKAKVGVYPPSTTNSAIINPLYYELMGTTNVPSGKTVSYQPLDGSSGWVTAPDIQAAFKVDGFINSSRGASGDEGTSAVNYFRGAGLKANQVANYTNKTAIVKLLVATVPWPDKLAFQPVPAQPGLNPWRYNSANPTNNPTTYDLWIDVVIDGQTNRICNWSGKPLINVP